MMWYLILNDEQYTMLLFENEIDCHAKCAELGTIWSYGSAKHLAVTNGEN